MGFVDSAVNQIVNKRFAKKQQMQWTKKSAHLVPQMRTQVLDKRLEDTFGDWYPLEKRLALHRLSTSVIPRTARCLPEALDVKIESQAELQAVIAKLRGAPQSLAIVSIASILPGT